MRLAESKTSFAGVIDTFQSLFAHGHDVGSCLCIYQDGVKVVDAVGGHTNLDRNAPYPPQAQQMMFSITKAVLGNLAGTLMEEGALELEAPVGRYRPAFLSPDKRDITVRHLLAHQAVERARPV